MVKYVARPLYGVQKEPRADEAPYDLDATDQAGAEAEAYKYMRTRQISATVQDPKNRPYSVGIYADGKEIMKWPFPESTKKEIDEGSA